MPAHHTVTFNGSVVYQLNGSLDEARARLGRMLTCLDGKKDYSIVVGALPEGKELDDVDVRTWPKEYMQSAGSSDAMTVEVREIVDGEPKQYVIGRSGDARSGNPDVEIPWDKFVVKVYEDEVFDAGEAIELYAHYLDHGSAPPDCVSRLLDLTAKQ